MSNADSPPIIVVARPDLPASKTVAGRTLLQQLAVNRREVIGFLRRLPGFLDAARAAFGGPLVRVRLPKEVWARLANGTARWGFDKSGDLLPTVVDEHGKFLQQARLDPLIGNFTEALSRLIIQQGLVRIEDQIREVQEAIEGIRQGQVEDRKGQLQGGIHLFEQAITLSDATAKAHESRLALQSLSEARSKLLENAAGEIRRASRIPTNGFYFRLQCFLSGSGLVKKARMHLNQAGEEVRCALEATRYIVAARQMSDEHDAARVAVEQLRGWWLINAPSAARTSRLLPVSDRACPPETAWGAERIEQLQAPLLMLDAPERNEVDVVLELGGEDIDGQPNG